MRTIIGNITQASKAWNLIQDKEYFDIGVYRDKDSKLLLEGLFLYKKNVKEKIGWGIKGVGGHFKKGLWGYWFR